MRDLNTTISTQSTSSDDSQLSQYQLSQGEVADVASVNCILEASPLKHAKIDRGTTIQQMVREFQETDFSSPDVTSCNSVLAVCLSNRSKRASEIACSLVRRMMSVYAAGDSSMVLRPELFQRLFANLYSERDRICVEAAAKMVSGISFVDETFARSSYAYALTVCALSRNPASMMIRLQLRFCQCSGLGGAFDDFVARHEVVTTTTTTTLRQRIG